MAGLKPVSKETLAFKKMANILKQLDGVVAVGLRNNVPVTWLLKDSAPLREAVKAVAFLYGIVMDIDVSKAS